MSGEKVLSIAIEAIALAILTAVVYWIAIMLMSRKRVLPIMLVVLEIVALAALTVGTYFGAWLLVGALARIYRGLPFTAFAILVAIIDVVYICTIKFWPLKNIHIKIIVGLLLFAFSAAIVTCYIVIRMMRFGW
jgi:hypothetical protein